MGSSVSKVVRSFSVISMVIISSFNMEMVLSEYASAKGRVLCDGVALKYVKVRLMDSDIDWDDEFGTSKASVDGYFVVDGSADDIWGAGAPDPYIQIAYYYSGIYGTLDVEDGIIASTAYDETSERSFSSAMDFGTINLNNKKCKTYLNMLNAMIDYYNRNLHVKIPQSTLYVRLDAILIGSTPYSELSQINVPSAYGALSYDTSQHELAHTVRHYYDGSYAHFLADVLSYSYMQYHSCGSKTNVGFAFNEGWAEFWDDGCKSYTGTDYTIEGNVASALRKLKTTCSSTDARFISILKNNAGNIHSFSDFNNKYGATYNCKL